jgi:hypothetical protein
MLPQLARLQQLAASWVSTPSLEQPSSGVAEGPVSFVEMLPFADQVRVDQLETICRPFVYLACHGRQRLGGNPAAVPCNVVCCDCHSLWCVHHMVPARLLMTGS